MRAQNLNIKKKKITNNLNEFEAIAEESRIADEAMHIKRKPTEVPAPNPKIKMEVPKLKKKRGKFKTFLIAFGIIFLTVLIIAGIAGYYYLYIPYKNIKASAERLKSESYALLADFDSKDLTNIDNRFTTIRSELDYINSEIDRFDFLATSKYTKGYYDNAQVVRSIIAKTDNLLKKTLPDLKNVLSATGFKVEGATLPNESIPNTVTGEEIDEDEPGALTLIMSEMPRYLTLYDTIEPDIYSIFEDVKKIDPNYIPSIGGYDFKTKLAEANEFIVDYPDTSDQVTGFLKYMPELMGSDDPTRYLLILQNEAEMRSSGGLLTAFGNMTLENGELAGDISLSDMWNLEIYVSYSLGIAAGPDEPDFTHEYVGPYGNYQNIYGQNVLMNLGCGSTYLRAQDAGIYPDLNWTMRALADYYDIANTYDKENYPDYDHILILNHHFAESLIGLIQPLEVEGFGEVTAETLFDFIKQETDNPDLAFDAGRKDIIKDIANAAKEKFFEKEIKDLPQIMTTIIKAIYARDIALASESNPELQAFFDQYNISGRFEKEFDGDYFHLNEAQNCALKLNKWVRDTVTQNITIADDGSIHKDVRVNWQNAQIYNPSIEKQYSSTEQFSYRAWTRIFAPIDVATFDSDGYEASNYVGYFPQEYNDPVMNKAVSDNIIQFDHRRFDESDPIEKQELNVSYDLPSSLNYNLTGSYKMLIQKHPGKSWNEPYIVNISYLGKNYTIEFNLDQDKVLTFKNGIIRVDNFHKELDWVLSLMQDIPFEDL